VARDRKRAKQRCDRRRAEAPARNSTTGRRAHTPQSSQPARDDVPGALEHASGDVVGVEVKAAETARGDDFRGLRHLANRLESRFRAGFVLYAGEESLSFGERLKALPIAALWKLAG